jgi:hypothetical protein
LLGSDTLGGLDARRRMSGVEPAGRLVGIPADTPGRVSEIDAAAKQDLGLRDPSEWPSLQRRHHLIACGRGTPRAVSLTGGNRNGITQLVPLVDAATTSTKPSSRSAAA